MSQIKFTQVLSYSSQDANHPADNLLRSDTFRKWKCTPNTSEKQSFVILKFDQLTSINSLDIGNDGSALVEVLVSREGMSDYQVLLVSSAFMSPAESRNGTDLNRVRMFGPDKLNKNVAEQKWDRLKIVCTQPFNTKMQYGLSFITARSLENGKQESSQKVTQLGKFKLKMEDDSDPIAIGSMFAKRNEKTPLPLTEPGSIRAASREIAAAASSAETLKRKDPPSDGGSSQLKKKTATESTRSPLSKNTPPTSHTTNHNKGKQNEKQSKPERREGKPMTKNSGGREEKDNKKESKNKNKENTNNKPSSSKADTQETTRRRKSKPFNSLMDNVVFVMSGYENPERSILRDKLTDMGAQYKSDWKPGCTHLICAFTNTPKYRQAKGKGKIVTGKWIADCYKNKIRYPCRRYGLEKHKDGSESEEEIWAEELLPKVSQPNLKAASPKPINDSDAGEDSNYSDDEDTDDEIQKILDKQKKNKPDVTSDTEASSSNNYKKDKSESSLERDKAITTKQSDKDGEKGGYERTGHRPGNNRDCSTTNGHKNGSDEDIYDDDTDIDEELPDTSSLPLPTLGDYFKGKCFFFYGNMAEEKRKLVTRFVTAYDGQIEDYMNEKVQFVLSDSKWDENFEEALNDNPALQFVKTQWIWQCCDKKKLVPHQPFLIVPKE